MFPKIPVISHNIVDFGTNIHKLRNSELFCVFCPPSSVMCTVPLTINDSAA